MQTNDIKKGMRVMLRNGWEGIMYDNKKGNTRMVEVYGHYTEIGSVYAWDIVQAQVDKDIGGNQWVTVILTPKQLADRNRIKAMGF